MKILVLGDIHGRDCWKRIVKGENADLVIFLGDYVASPSDMDVPSDIQIDNLMDILKYRERNMDRVILLRGNHDMQHLNYAWASCSRYDRTVAKCMEAIEERFLKLTQWVFVWEDNIFSHAGVSKKWWDSLKLGSETKDNILKINELEPTELFGFTPDRLSDYYGNSETQPCTWIRPYSLIRSHVEGWNQVVGHTRLPFAPGGNIFEIVKDNWDDLREQWGITMKELWCIDSLPDYYLLIEDGEKRLIENIYI